MKWPEIRQAYPNTWLIVEAIEAHTTADSRRVLDRLAVIESCKDGKDAMQRYHHYHQEYPYREFYFVSTRREELKIIEQNWLWIMIGISMKSSSEN